MNIRRLPLAFLLGGILLKALLIVTWRVSRLPALLIVLMRCDPVAVFFAERTTAAFYDQRRLFPGAAEGLFFELALTLAFGVECLFVGLLIRWFWSHRTAQVGSRPVTTGR
jgi:hypothetical protein